MEDFSSIFDAKSNMGTVFSDFRMGREHENSYGDYVRHHKLNIVVNYLISFFKKDMATVTLGYKIILFLGSLIVGNSFLMAWKVKLLNIDFGQAPVPFKMVMYFLSCCVLTVGVIRGVIGLFHAIQKWRELKLNNDLFERKNRLKDKQRT